MCIANVSKHLQMSVNFDMNNTSYLKKIELFPIKIHFTLKIINTWFIIFKKILFNKGRNIIKNIQSGRA